MKKRFLYLLCVLIVNVHSATSNAANLITYTDKNTSKVSGVVYDENKDPLVGVSIKVRGTNVGTISDYRGSFSINVSEDDFLEVSYLGFEQQLISVNSRSFIEVNLREDVLQLEDVVVVGYGTQKKVNLTGAVSTISFDEKMEGRPLMNASTALSGLSPGLQVMQTSSKPGDDGATLLIRGTTTINNSSPLVLIDGFEADINNINTNDIESISILKDASATAIYGSRAANGVILVTTKKGKGKVSVSLGHFTSFLQPINKLEFVSDYADHMEYINEGRRNMNKTEIFSSSNIEAWRAAKLDPNGLNAYGVPNYIAYPNTNWFNEIFNTGLAQEYNLTIQKGDGNTKYLISAGYLDNEGVMSNSGLEKFMFRTNLETKVSDWWVVGTRIFGLKQSKGVGNISRGFEYLYQSTPGIYPGVENKWGSPALTSEESSTANNIFEKMALDGYDKMFRANATLFSTITLFKSLNIEMLYNYAPDWGDYATWGVEKGIWDYVEDKRRSESALENSNIYNSSFKRERHTADIILKYNKNIGVGHSLNLMFGYNQTYYSEESFSATKKGMTDWGLHVLNTATNLEGITGSKTDWSLRSLFGRANYAYKSKYLFEGNLRYDESSRFGPQNRGGFFPSFSIGWRLMEEDFMQQLYSVADNLKIRASWGKLGNNQLGNYDWQAGYGKTNVVLDGVPTTALIMNKYSNPSLHWESVVTSDIGLDLDVLKNRLSLEFDYYHKHTTGMILTPDNFLTSGTISAATQNAAELINMGVELSLKWKDKIKDFKYEIGGTFAYNTNMVTKYRGKLEKGWSVDEDGNEVFTNNIGDVSRSGFGGLILEGHMLGETYLLPLYRGNGNYNPENEELDINAGPIDGMIRTENDLKWVQAMQAAGYRFSPSNVVGQTNLYYGDLIYADSNEDKIYGDSNDMEFTGRSRIPKYNFGFNLAASYKGFDFYSLWSGSADFYYYWNQMGYNSPETKNGFSINKLYAENAYRWDPNDPDSEKNNQYGTMPRLSDETKGVNGASSEFWEYNASFLKLKNVQFGYTIPTKYSKRILIEKLRVYVSGENLLTFTQYPGLDPEIGANVGYPLTKRYALGLNITF